MPRSSIMADDDDERHEYVEDSQESTDPDHEFVPQKDDDEKLFEVIEITAEKKHTYQVRWAGIDSKTNKPWPLDWVPKKDCTPGLVDTWKKTKAEKDKRKAAKLSRSTNAASSSKGKGKAKESPKDTYVPVPARRTRASLAKKRPTASPQKPAPPHLSPPSSPGGIVIKRGPPIGVKRKRDEVQQQDATEPPSPDGPQSEPPEQAVPKKKKVRKLNRGANAQASFAGPLPPVKSPRKAAEKERYDPNVAELPLPEPDLIPEFVTMLDNDLWPNPFAPDDAAASNASKDAVVSESQPRADGDESTLILESLDPPPAYASHDELAGSSRTRSRQNVANSDVDSAGPSMTKAKRAASAPRKSTEAQYGTPGKPGVHRKKPLGPVPRPSPSIFHPYIGQPASPIEQFDSPGKSRDPVQSTAQSAVRRHKGPVQASHDAEDVTAEELAEEFLDWTGANAANPEPHPSPVQAQNLSQSSIWPPSPVRSSFPPENELSFEDALQGQDDMVVSPQGSSMFAVRDSQSNTILVPDSQLSDLNLQLQAKEDTINELRRRIEAYEDTTAKLTIERDARATENTQLQSALLALRAEHETCPSAEQFDELQEVNNRRQARIKELEAAIDAAEPSKEMHEEQLRKLQGEVEQWKGLCEALQMRSEVAGEKTNALEAQSLQLQAKIAELELQLSELQGENMSPEKTVSNHAAGQDSDDEMDDAAARNQWLEGRVKGLLEQLDRSRIENSELLQHMEELLQENEHLREEVENAHEDVANLQDQLQQTKQRSAEIEALLEQAEMSIESQTSQVNEWVCIYRFAPGDECRETFSTRKAVSDHFIGVHVPE